MMAMIDQTDLDHSIIDYWLVADATGREYRLNIAPWYKRWLSARRRLGKARRESKERVAKELQQKKVNVGDKGVRLRE